MRSLKTNPKRIQKGNVERNPEQESLIRIQKGHAYGTVLTAQPRCQIAVISFSSSPYVAACFVYEGVSRNRRNETLPVVPRAYNSITFQRSLLQHERTSAISSQAFQCPLRRTLSGALSARHLQHT